MLSYSQLHQPRPGIASVCGVAGLQNAQSIADRCNRHAQAQLSATACTALLLLINGMVYGTCLDISISALSHDKMLRADSSAPRKSFIDSRQAL